MKIRAVLSVLVATAWISISEFARNEFLLKSYWTSHYEKLGLVFPSEPINGAFWGIWSLVFAAVIYVISRKFTLMQTSLLAWVLGFVMMWLVVWNLSVLPVQILALAIPLSMLEAFLASYILIAMNKNNQ